MSPNSAEVHSMAAQTADWPSDPPQHSRYDAIVIGAGHNGLVCASFLARAGKRVLVVEQRPQIGGATASEEHYPGFTYSACSYVVSLLRPWIVRHLELPRFGYRVFPLDETFTPFPDGRYLLRDADPHRTRDAIARFSAADADAYPKFGRAMSELGRRIRSLIDEPAPDPIEPRLRDLRRMLKLGREIDDELETLFRISTMSAVDFLERYFESPQLLAAMSVSGIIGTFLGVRSPGTAYVLLHHYMGDIDGAYRAWGIPEGGTGAVAQAIARSAAAHGAEILINSPVERVLLKRERAVGVALENGDEIRADRVVSAAEPRRTFFGMVGREHLPADFIAGLERYKLRGSSGKVNLALDGLPEFTCLPDSAGGGKRRHLRGDITIAPSIDYLETAYDDAKRGRFSRRPFLDSVIPSLSDPGVAPAGKHVMSIFVQYAPYHLTEGPEDWPNQREAFGDAVVGTLTEYAPNLPSLILHRQVLTPWDLEQEYGLTEGNIFHGELSLEQLAFQRPVAGWSRYRSPIRGLWMGGSGTHPGGGIMGASGALCALELLGARRP